MQQSSDSELLDALTRIASHAAAAILAVAPEDLQTRAKPDRSPVTAADHASEEVILAELKQRAPGIPVISEESAARQARPPAGARFLLVDPLDGTQEFIAGLDEFAINIALIDNSRPHIGVIAAPKRGLIWRGIAGQGAERLALAPGAEVEAARERMPIHTRKCPASGARVLLSRSHPEPESLAFVNRLDRPERMACGSSLKYGLIAEGAADLHLRYARLSEWDVAAGHALMLAAGGDIVAIDGTLLRYGHADLRLPPFIAFGDANAPRP